MCKGANSCGRFLKDFHVRVGVCASPRLLTSNGHIQGTRLIIVSRFQPWIGQDSPIAALLASVITDCLVRSRCHSGDAEKKAKIRHTQVRT